MITWMQRHKKYLVVTIWISVIAFVGAGTVGWGSVDLNTSRSKYVATVGKLGITHKEFNDKFNELFIMQNQLANGELTNEQALKLGLDKQALIELMREKLLLNYSKDLGFYASDEEVLKTIASDKMFHKSESDASFDKEKYLAFLKAIRLSESDFAQQVKDKLEISKLLKLLNVKPSEKEFEILNASVNMQDEINLKIIDLANKADEINVDAKELEKYWQEHKSEYKSELSYEYSIFTLEPKVNNFDEAELKNYWESNKFNYKNDDGKLKEFNDVEDEVKLDYALSLLEKEAKLDYVKLKKGELEFSEKSTENAYSKIALQAKNLKENELSKPFIMDKKYYIVRLDRINHPSELSFELAKDLALEDFKDYKFKLLLEKTAEDEMKKDKIDGTNIGFISKLSKNNTELSDTEFYTFINELFTKTDKKSFVILSDKVIAYEILSQKLGDTNDEKTYENELRNINFSVMFDDLLQALQKIYPVKNYYKGSEI